MKRSLKRVISFWAAVLMMLNIVIPTGAVADVHDPSAEYQATLPTALPDRMLLPGDILGEAVEYGVIAEEYKQSEHTETNFAVYRYEQDSSKSILIKGSGANRIPFKVAKLNGNSQFFLDEETNVDVDVFINEDQTDRIHIANGASGKTAQIIRQSEDTIKKDVEKLLARALRYSSLMSSRVGENATVIPRQRDIIDGYLDFTRDPTPQSGTIYVDCSDPAILAHMTSFPCRICKSDKQTLVFNFPQSGQLTFGKVILKVKDVDGNPVTFPGNTGEHEDNANILTSETAKLDADPVHNGYVDTYILRHFVYNAYNATKVTLKSSAGIFFAPKADVYQGNDAGAGAGWVITKKNFISDAEWHYYFHDRHYEAYEEKGVTISKVFTNQDGSAVSAADENKTFSFKITNYYKTKRVGGPDKPTNEIATDTKFNETISGPAGDLSFTPFGVHNTDFTNNNGEIEGDQTINWYLKIEEVPDNDSTIIYDDHIEYIRLEAHGHQQDKIELKLFVSTDGENGPWVEKNTLDSNVGTFTNYKKQFTDIQVEKEWRRQTGTGDDDYTVTTDEHTGGSVKVALVASCSPVDISTDVSAYKYTYRDAQ